MFEKVTAENGVVYLRSTLLPCPHGFSTRQGGVSTLEHTSSLNLAFRRGDDEETVLNNLALVSEAVGIPEDQIFVCATHNHSAPDINFYKDEVMADWLERICFPAILAAAKNAVDDLSPCTLQMGKTDVPKVAYTRRYFREDGAFHGIHVIKTSSAPIARHETEADPELRLVRFVREGKKDVVIVNFQVHAATALTASSNLSADFITALRDEVEAKEEVLVMYLQGGCGNSNTFSKLDSDAPNKDFLLAGHRLAQGVLRIIGDLEPIESGEIRLDKSLCEGVVNHGRTAMAPLAKQIFEQIEKEGITSEQEKRELFQANGFNSRYEASAILRRSKMDKTASVSLIPLPSETLDLPSPAGNTSTCSSADSAMLPPIR